MSEDSKEVAIRAIEAGCVDDEIRDYQHSAENDDFERAALWRAGLKLSSLTDDRVVVIREPAAAGRPTEDAARRWAVFKAFVIRATALAREGRL